MSKQEILKNYNDVPFTEEEKGALQEKFVGPIEVIKIGWRLFKENLVRVFALPFLFQILVAFGFVFFFFILLVLFVVMLGASATSIESSNSPEQFIASLGVSALIFVIFLFIAYIATIFFMVYFSLKQIYLLNNKSCEGVLKTPNIFYGKTLVSIITSLVLGIIISVLLLPFFALLIGSIFSFVSESIVVGIILLLLTLIYFIAFLVFSTLFNYFIYFIVIEGKGVIESISESYNLVKPYLLREFLRNFIVSIIISAPSLIFSLIQNYLSELNSTSSSAGLSLLLLALIPVSIVISFLTSSVILGAQYTSFYNLRQLSLK